MKERDMNIINMEYEIWNDKESWNIKKEIINSDIVSLHETEKEHGRQTWRNRKE